MGVGVALTSFSLGMLCSTLLAADLRYQIVTQVSELRQILTRTYQSDNLPVLTVVLLLGDLKSPDLKLHAPKLVTDIALMLYQGLSQKITYSDFVMLKSRKFSSPQLLFFRGPELITQCTLVPWLTELDSELRQSVQLSNSQNGDSPRFTALSATLAKLIRQALGRDLRLLERRYGSKVTTQSTDLRGNGLPHYYPQPYLGGYHAFGTPYRMDYFYRYYGPRYGLGANTKLWF